MLAFASINFATAQVTGNGYQEQMALLLQELMSLKKAQATEQFLILMETIKSVQLQMQHLCLVM